MNWDKRVFDSNPFNDIYIFDVHGHIGTYAYNQLGNSEPSEVVHTINRLGVNAICVSDMMQLSSDWECGNCRTAEATEKYPGKIYGYVSPNPFYEDCDLKPYFERYDGIRGIKIHGNLNIDTPLDDPRYQSIYELANERKLPVLYHAWETWEVKKAIEVARRYPDAIFILGHSGFRDFETKQVAIDGCKKYENIYLDTAISSMYDGAIEWLVSKIGSDKLLYGSDMAFFDCCHTLGQIAMSKLSDVDKEKIFGINAQPIFNL